MNFLIDHNLERYAVILLGKIANDSWLDLIPIRFITFREIGLSIESSDRFYESMNIKGAIASVCSDLTLLLMYLYKNCSIIVQFILVVYRLVSFLD